MTQNVNRLYKNRNTFYYRVRIPKDLMRFFQGKEDLKRSLRTKSLKQARRLLRIWDHRTEEVFTTMRTGMLSDEQIAQVAREYLHGTLRAYEEERAADRGVPKDREALDQAIENNIDEEGATREALAFNNTKFIETDVRAYLAAYHGLDINPESLEFRKLARELLKQRLEVNRIENERLQGNYANGYDDRPQAPSQVSPAVPSGRSFPLSEVINKYMDVEYHKTGKASEHSVKEYEYQCKLFQEATGNKELGAVTRDDVRNFLKMLKRYPKNANKLKQYRSKTLAEIAAIEIPAGETLGDTTIDKYLARVNTLLTWAVNEGWIEKNPAAGIQHVRKDTGTQHYLPFNREELERMLEGFLTVAQKGELRGKPERLWLPLLALFTGARLNELAQLHIGDIQKDQETEIWFLRIEAAADGSKRVKNAASNREVPLHPELLSLGFLEYYREMVAKNAPRLWMNLSETKKGYYRNFSNWFLKSPLGAGFKYTHITEHPKKVFHSFRDTLITELMRKDVSLSKIQNIVGHIHGNITGDTYFSEGHTLTAKLEALRMLDYGVDLGPLKEITPGG
jgi:integrase